MTLPQENKRYTYADYLTWQNDKRYEIINGVPYMQSASAWQHQAVSRELLLQFGEYLRDKEYQVFAAPFDLRLPDGEENDEDCISINS